MSDLPRPGIYDVPVAIYESWPAARITHLKRFGKSAAHYRQAELEPRDPTPALELGRAVHHATLEPDTFEKEWIASPGYDKRTKKGQAAWAEWHLQHPLQSMLSAKDFQLCLNLREAAYSHPLAAKLLGGKGRNEISVLWIDPATGLPCKARLDRLTTFNSYSTIADVKTLKDASPKEFARDVHKYGWHQQSAHYLNGLEVLLPRTRRFIFIVLEKEPPYCVAIYEIDDQALDQGRREVAGFMQQYKDATTTDIWPGYDEGLRLISLPRWAQRQEENEEW